MWPARYLMLFWLLGALLAHADPLQLLMASGTTLHQNNLATLWTSLVFLSAFSMNYLVHSLSCLRQGSVLLFPKMRQERRGGIYKATFKSALHRHRNPVQELLLNKKLGLPMTMSSLSLKKSKLWERVSKEDDCAYCPAELRSPQKGCIWMLCQPHRTHSSVGRQLNFPSWLWSHSGQGLQRVTLCCLPATTASVFPCSAGANPEGCTDHLYSLIKGCCNAAFTLYSIPT